MGTSQAGCWIPRAFKLLAPEPRALRRNRTCLLTAATGLLTAFIVFSIPGAAEAQAPLVISVVSGDNQAGIVGFSLDSPFVVKVTRGVSLISGASVAWTVKQGGGTLSSSSTVTGKDGQSQTTLTPTTAGQIIVSVTCSFIGSITEDCNNSVTFTAAVTPLTLSIVSGNNQAGVLGVPLELPFVVKVANGDAVAGASVTWAVTQGSGSLSPPSPTTTGEFGQSQTTLTPTGAGQIVVTVTCSLTRGEVFQQCSNSVTFTATATPLTLSIVSGNNQTGVLGVALDLPFVVKVANTAKIAGASVTWTLTQGSGTLAPPSPTTTGDNGQSQTTLTPATTGGNGQVIVTATASFRGQQSNSVTFTASVTSPTLSVVSGNNQTGVINAPLAKPLVVSVTGVSPNATVSWALTQGGGTFSPNPSPIVTGQSQTTLTLGPTPGPITVTASVSSGSVSTSVTFKVNDATQAATAGLKQFSVMGNVALLTTTVQTTNIGFRLAALRGGATGISLSGLSVSYDGQTVPLAAATSFIPSPGKGGGASADPSRAFGGGLGIFLNGQGSFGDQRASSREPGFDFHTAGLTLGGDYRITNSLVLGGAFGYLRTKTELDASAGDMKTDGYSFSAYGTYYVSNKFYVDGIATYGWNHYNTTRNISFSDSSATAKGSPDGNQFAISANGGYNFNVGPLTAGPTLRVNYIRVHIDGFKEHGADLFNLNVDSQKVESLATDLGGQVSYAISMPWGVLLPLARFEWEHEYKGGSRLITGSLVADPLHTSFAVPTNNPDRDYFNLGAGITATLKRGLSAFVYYETVLGRNNVTNHSFNAGVRFQFE